MQRVTTRLAATDPADAAAFAAVREVCRRHARELFFASHFLPRPKRDAAYAVYAFSRMIDDAIAADEASIDGAAGLRHHPAVVSPRRIAELPTESTSAGACGCGPTGSLDARLLMLRERLDEVYAGTIELPSPAARSEAQHALHAFSLAVQRYEIPREYFLEFAQGRRTDLTVRRYATWASLQRHCDHAGGVLGLIAGCVLGLTHSDAGRYAMMLGNAIRLTDILRDLKPDWERGRVYLPLEDLARFRYSERDLSNGVVNEPFRELMRFEIARARGMYRDAAEGLCWLAGDGSRLAASAFAVVHSGLLRAIERRQGYDVFTRSARLTTTQQFRSLPAAWRLARREAGQQVPDVFR
jgi:15-cis-phytoene synthase